MATCSIEPEIRFRMNRADAPKQAYTPNQYN